jgi:hypothetical protein
MKKIALTLFVLLLFQSCETEVDDTDKVCSENCTSVIGRIARADNTGIPNVKVTFSFLQRAPYDYVRHIAEAYTDNNGNYEIIGNIKDRELGTNKEFKISVDIEQIEDALSNNFLKPSELLEEIGPKVDEIIIPGVENREQIEIVDFVVPYRSDLTINLNNFQPIEQVDQFIFTNRVEYGFENQKIMVKYGRTETLNEQFSFTTGIGINKLKISKFKNAIFETETQEVEITETPSNMVLNIEY